jgi:nitroreductase
VSASRTESNGRTADHSIDPIYLNRWSPRAFNPEPISEGELCRMFEAARWAPSAYNSQPWRFIYARRDTEHWDTLFELLFDTNKIWAKNASVLMVLVSKKVINVPGKTEPIPSHSHSLDAGAAWAYLALEAARLGWHAHGMAGFDTSLAASRLHIPNDYRVEIAIALGKKGDRASLPEALAAREAPNTRNSQDQFAFEGRFPA